MKLILLSPLDEKMPKHQNKTSMGGAQSRFQTTSWTEILHAKTFDETRRRQITNELIRKYWKPVYCYLRRKGHSKETAEDMTQAFFHEVVLGRNLIQRADQTKGRFRTFLLTSLDRYSRDVYHKENASKRSPKGYVFSFDTEDLPEITELSSEIGPDEIFHYVWASEVLNDVLARVKEDCCDSDRETNWKLFEARIVLPIINGTDAPSRQELCVKYDINDTQKITNMVEYVKGRFRTAMTSCLRQFVQSDSEVEEEYNEIFKILSKKNLR